jgi:hypothetical protein
MRQRIIIKDGKFIPQVKSHWYSPFWNGIGAGSYLIIMGISVHCNTIEEAIKLLDGFVKQKKNDGFVVWKRTI